MGKDDKSNPLAALAMALSSMVEGPSDEDLEEKRGIIRKNQEILDEHRADLKDLEENEKKLKEALADVIYPEMGQLGHLATLVKASAALTLTIAKIDIKSLKERLEGAEKDFQRQQEMMRELEEQSEKRKKGKELIQKAKFRPGDNVMVSKNPLDPDSLPDFTEEIEKFKGRVVTISCVHHSETFGIYYHIEEDGQDKSWVERWLEPVLEEKKRKKLDH